MTDMSPETLVEAPGVTFAFYGKSKCHSQMTDKSLETPAEAQESHLLFLQKANVTHISVNDFF